MASEKEKKYDTSFNGFAMMDIKNLDEVMRKIKNKEFRQSNLPYHEWLDSIIEWKDKTEK